MTSLIARQALGSLRHHARPNLLRYNRRTIHLTPVVQKKRSNVVIDDLFPEDAIVEDLIPSPPPAKSTPVASTSGTDKVAPALDANSTETNVPKNRKLSSEARLGRFNKIIDFVTPRLGRKPAVKLPQVRNSAWVHMVELATNEEQLRKVVNMFPGWIESGRTFDPQFSELFVRRCEELSCPSLALEVFGNFSKYNVPLTLPGARHLIHSLHVEHPIESVVTASALYSVYSLPPVSRDLASCAMFLSACFKHNSTYSLKVANALVPHLQELLKSTKPIKISDNPTTRALNKPHLWIKWSLKKVDKALFVKNRERAEWLRRWRARSGHIIKPGGF